LGDGLATWNEKQVGLLGISVEERVPRQEKRPDVMF
jgi:hypothetical protein